MKLICVTLLVIILTVDAILSKECPNKKLNSKLICYYSNLDLKQITNCKCSHIVLSANTGLETINQLRDVVKKSVKLLITIDEFNQDVVDLLNSNQLDGIELNLKKLKSRDDISDFLSTIRQKFNNLSTLLAVPTKPEILAKYYDFKTLTKYVDGFVLQTAFLGMSKNVTFHPSRLSGLWDIQNTDSVVDLVNGLGAPLSKLIITAPVQGFQFKLQNTKHTAPGSPALEIQTISRDELCKSMRNGQNWTLERDQDQAGPFIFSDDQWIAFDDPTSIDIKAKYSRIRGLAGLALKDLAQDGGGSCGTALLDAAFDGLNRQARAPRGAVLHSLEREIREIPHTLDTVQVSPYRITRVIDVEGNIHAIRQDSRTEFACSRQGYFVHPRSCNRFYRCVKFDQLTDEFNVFEFDCPAGLVFDERVEVCVWPGNLEHGSPCAGSSEIAPVPQQRFACPSEPGYYADPENCRWFFACLDHGKSSPSAYEFRCPFGLVFDESRLLCEWAWLVPRCSSGYTTGSAVVYGHGAAVPLEQYDGLGVLPVTQLGGLSGPLQQPVAQIYTNVGTGGIIANTDSSGYKFINTNAGFGGLSANAALSLQNAGLLNVGQYNTFGRQGANYQEAGKYVSAGDVGSLYQNNGAILQNSHQNVGTYFTGLEDSGKISGNSAVLTTDQQNAHLINNLAHGTSAQIVGNAEFAAKSHQNIAQYHQLSNNEAVLNQNNIKLISTSSHGTGIAGNINIVGGGYSAVSNFDRGIEISNNGVGSSTIAHVTASPISVTTLPSVPTVTTVPIPSISTATSFQSYKGGVVANLPQLQYRLDGHDLQLQSGHSSGFSTSQQNVDVANISTNYVNLISSTPDYGSGVGIVSTPASVLQGEQLLQIPARATGSYSYENQGLIGDYVYNKAAALEGASLKTGNNGAKSLTFIQSQPTIQPVVSVSNFHNYYAESDTNAANAEKKATLQSESKLVQPAVSVSTFEGYLYDRPSVKFEEKPLQRVQPLQTVTTFQQPSVVVQPTLQTVTQQPDVKIQSIVQPTVPIPLQPTIQAVIKQPSAVSVSSFQGYNYQKPSVQYEERPLIKVQPTLSVSTFQGYNYQKPTVQFENRPLIKVQPSVQPSVQTVVQPAVSFQTYQSYSNNKASAVAEEHGVESLGTVVEQYNYQKPSEQLEERPLAKIQPSVQPTVQTVVQPAVSYQTFQSYGNEKGSTSAEGQTLEKVEAVGSVVEQQPTVPVSTFQGYNYQRPSVQFEERPLIKVQPSVQPTVQTVVQPAVSFQTYQSYSNNKASAAAEEQAVKSLGTVVEQYNYQKPSEQLEERPLPSVQPTVQTVVQPTVSYLTFQSYGNEKGSTSAEGQTLEKVEAVVGAVVDQQPTVPESTFQGYNYQRPSVQFEERPLIKVQPSVQPTVQPAVSLQTFQSYSSNEASQKAHEKVEFSNTVIEQQPAVSVATFNGYNYQKPSVQFEERPLIRVQPSVQPTVQTVVQPAVSFQTYQSYSNNKASAATEENNYGKFESLRTVIEQEPVVPVLQPATSFSTFQSYGNHQTANVNEGKTFAKTESQETVVQQQPAVSTFQGYRYQRPTIQFEERPLIKVQPTVQVPVIKQPALSVASFETYSQTEEKPQIKTETPNIKTVSQPAVSFSTFQSYNDQKSVVPLQPTVQSVIKQQPVVQGTTFQGYDYRRPSVVFEEKPQIYVSSTPAPIVSSTPALVSSFSISSQTQQQNQDDYAKSSVVLKPVQPVVQKTILPAPPSTYNFQKLIEDYTYTEQQTPAVIGYTASTAKPAVVSSYSYTAPGYNYRQPEPTGYVYEKPQIKFEEEPLPVTEVPFVKKTAYVTGNLDQNSAYNAREQNEEVNSKFDGKGLYVENYQISSTPRPNIDYAYIQTSPRPTFDSTILTASKIPVTPKQFYYYDSRLSSTPQPEIQYATVLPTVTVVASTTSRPIAKYSFSSLDETPIVPQYKPIRQRVKITTPVPTQAITVPELSREYLPVATRVRVTTPAQEYLPVAIQSTTAAPIEDEVIISTRRPAKVVKIIRPKTIIKQNDFNPLLMTKLGAQCTCTSNTLRLRKKPVKIIVETDDDDDGYVVDSNNDGQIIENYQYESQRTASVTPTIERASGKSRVTDGEIVKAVRTGLNLVKEAVKDGTEEALNSKSFDRYGPGGVRSRNERLQGTIDCQRAGLFRHPSECNKFYSCRWDCTKNRYTLHVFNCPVHLTFDNSLGACNWPSQGPACLENTLLPSD